MSSKRDVRRAGETTARPGRSKVFSQAGHGVEVHVVIEHAEVCADASQVEVAVRAGLPPAFVARGARLRVQLERGTRGTEAQATLVLADGAVESRAFTTSSRACASLVRALGAWVSVRMDE